MGSGALVREDFPDLIKTGAEMKLQDETRRGVVVDQFVQDFTLVVDNDREMFEYIMNSPNTINKNVAGLSEELKDEFETRIDFVIQNLNKGGKYNSGQLTALLISQMLMNLGSETYDTLARYYIEIKTEQEKFKS